MQPQRLARVSGCFFIRCPFVARMANGARAARSENETRVKLMTPTYAPVLSSKGRQTLAET
jgi:hypothetical protein